MNQEKLEKTLEEIAVEVVKHTEVFGKMADDVSKLKQTTSELMNGQDKMLTILQRLDQERIFTIERVKRLEEEVQKIKTHLAVA
ncbi:MAG: hypothetical protein ABH836_04685 [Candidatus Omnitrophota bacterium]